MIILLDVLFYALCGVTNFFIFSTIKSLLPIRKSFFIQILAFLFLYPITSLVIYLGDAVNSLSVLVGFYLYALIFFKGSVIPKLSVATILYPLIVAVNYLCQDLGKSIWFVFFEKSAVSGEIVSTALHAVSFLPCLVLWAAVWRYCKNRMAGIHELLDNKMWLLLDSICATVFISLFVVISFLADVPNAQIVAYTVSLAGIITVIGCFYLVVYMSSAIQTGYQLKNLQMEYQYYEDKLKEEARVRAIYHDMKNHLLVLQSAESGAEVKAMLAAMQERILGYENYYKTGNTFLDVIVRDKAEEAKEHGIDFSVMLHFEDGEFIDPLDVSAIFGNALDNAIEASLKLPISERLMTVKAVRVHDMLSIVIENYMADVVEPEYATQKPDKLLHGFGLKNIEQAVAKYDGQCSVSQKDGRFTMTIIIPIP